MKKIKILTLSTMILLSNYCLASDIKLLFVGDVLLHQPQHTQAINRENGHISLWSTLVEEIQKADISYANLEGPIAPGIAGLGRKVKDPGRVFDKNVYTSYPMFNYHDFLADDLKNSGFDIVSTSNNHSLDRSSIGADLTIENLNRVGLNYTGTRHTQNMERSFATRLERNGLVFSYIACTESTNGIPDRNKQVLICNQDTLDLVQKEKSLVDIVVVTPHWGDEYQTQPAQRQKHFAKKLADSGADIIVGSHPHVPQPMEYITSIDGRNVPVLYSLGNFVSNQFHRVQTQNEYMAIVTVAKNGNVIQNTMELKKMKMKKQNGYEVIFENW